MIEDKDIVAAQSVPFSPYARFMNATKGLYYKDMTTGDDVHRFHVWLREKHSPTSIKRIIRHEHSNYVAMDKEGWTNGIMVDKQKAGMYV